MKKAAAVLAIALTLSLPALAKFGKKALPPESYSTALYRSYEDVRIGQSCSRGVFGANCDDRTERRYKIEHGGRIYTVRFDSATEDPFYKIIPETSVTVRIDEEHGELWTTVMECCVGWRDKRKELHEVKYKILSVQKTAQND